MADPTKPPHWQELMGEMFGSDERCLVCGQWVPQWPTEHWIIVVGPDYFGVVHNYESLSCLTRERNWKLCLP